MAAKIATAWANRPRSASTTRKASKDRQQCANQDQPKHERSDRMGASPGLKQRPTITFGASSGTTPRRRSEPQPSAYKVKATAPKAREQWVSRVPHQASAEQQPGEQRPADEAKDTERAAEQGTPRARTRAQQAKPARRTAPSRGPSGGAPWLTAGNSTVASQAYRPGSTVLARSRRARRARSAPPFAKAGAGGRERGSSPCAAPDSVTCSGAQPARRNSER